MKSLILIPHLFICLCFGSLSAQLKSPLEFLPHSYGKEFTPHHLLQDYFEYVARESPNVILEEIGQTNEHRTLFIAIVSSPSNLSRIEEIRMNNLRLTGHENGEPDIHSAKSIVWLGYSVHGNEAGGSEASMQVVYDLATGAKGSDSWLDNTIVILEPSVNPDGYSRYTSWNNQVSRIDYDPSTDAREHHEPWPGGRVNHYLFDLNRDWAWLTQVESQQRVAAYQRWMPHVVADLHEMGYTSPYYFAPAAQPYHEFISEWQRDFQVAVGRNHARHFDREGWTYFTKEVFDLFYPSYGDTYPVFNGAIGMTYEQGGHGFAGRGILLPNGDTLFLEDRIARHRSTSLSTIEVTAVNTQKIVTEFAEYFRRSATNPPGQYKTYVVKATNPRTRIRSLCRYLDAQGIRYGRNEEGKSMSSAYSYQSGTEVSLKINNDDLVISAYQPRGILTQVLFDPESRLVDTLTYDITCWSLPFAYGLEAYALEDRLNVERDFEILEGEDEVPPDAYAYIARWESKASGQLLAAALREGIQARFATSMFVVDGKSFPAGSVLFMKNDNEHVGGYPDNLISIARSMSISLQTVSTGLVDLGKDLGSSAYALINAPSVLTIAGEGVSPNAFGQVWHLFEKELAYPLTVVDVDDLGSVEWSDYNTLILPEGYYKISQSMRKELDAWISSGGKVIAIGSALSHFSGKEGYALKPFADPATEEENKKTEQKDRLELRLEHYGESERRNISSRMPGAVFQCSVDTSHPLGFGLGETYHSLKTSPTSYEHLLDADNVIYLREELQYYGFAGYKALEKQKNSVVVAMEQKGSGCIVYMVDNPLFRAFWENGKFMFYNALFFAGN